MEHVVEAKVSPARVWDAWERAYVVPGADSGKVRLEKGAKGRKGRFRYEILEVTPGKSFSVLWKTLFVGLVFSHYVAPTRKGCEIRYACQIKGLFAWPVRKFLGKKIQANLAFVLKSIVKQLEENH